jgi:hypothetical protein
MRCDTSKRSNCDWIERSSDGETENILTTSESHSTEAGEDSERYRWRKATAAEERDAMSRADRGLSPQMIVDVDGVERPYYGALGTDAIAQEAMRAADRERAAQPPPTIRQEELLQTLGLNTKRFGLGGPTPAELDAVFTALYQFGFPQPNLGIIPKRWPMNDEHFFFWDRYLVNLWLDTFRTLVDAVTLSR